MPVKKIINKLLEDGNFNLPLKAKDVIKHLGLKLIVVTQEQIDKISIDSNCCSFFDSDLKTIYTLKGLSKHRMRMSIFHEIGHYLLDHKRHTEHQENEAYNFACGMLMPKFMLREDLKPKEELTFKDIDKISKKYNVSMVASAIWCTKVFHKPYALKRIVPLGVEYNGGKYRDIFDGKANSYYKDPVKMLELIKEYNINSRSLLRSNFFYRSRSFKGIFPNAYSIKGLPTIENSWYDKKDLEGYVDFGTPDYKKHFAMCRYLKESDSLLVLIKEE